MNRKSTIYLTFFVILGISLLYCSRPKEVLSRKSMENLLYDIYIAEAMIDNDYHSFDTPQKKEALISQVFKKHNITQAQWDSSLAWYSDRTDVYLRINDSVKARLKREQNALQLLISKQSSQQNLVASRFNSADYIPRLYSFSEISSQNGFRFKLDSVNISEKIKQDDFDFSFRVIGIPQQTPPNLITGLILQYKDTTIYKIEKVLHNQQYIINGQKHIRFNRDTSVINDTIRKIAGFIRLQDTFGRFKNIQLYNISLDKINNIKEEQNRDIDIDTEKLKLEKTMQKQ